MILVLRKPKGNTRTYSFLIGHHHTYSAIDALDFQILIASDFLVNAVEDNLSQDAVATSSQKYFKTQTGRRLLESAFLSR